jgi:tRNA threonylcarbamoyladenosine biosynthesis protein TsaE
VVRLVKILTKSAADTIRLGEAVGRVLRPGDAVAMTGPLGSGKSVLARGIMAGLGVGSKMPSPSFVIVATYEGTCTINHIDLYRLDAAEDAIALGLEDLLYSSSINIVEWAEKAADVLPESRLDVSLRLRARPEERLVTIVPACEEIGRRLLPLVQEGLAQDGSAQEGGQR